MKDEIISYREFCNREGIQTIQRGMNYRLNDAYSVILMSRRRNAPYEDRVLEDGLTVEYEGHDIPKSASVKIPKQIDQPRLHPSGKLTQNGLFAAAVEALKKGVREAEPVRVYEKVDAGVWSDKGFFRLVDYAMKSSDGRTIFKFYLKYDSASEERYGGVMPGKVEQHTRLIPSEVKKEVWRRDGGKCILCEAITNLHFDHDIPYSKGGASITPDNVRILCARHNIQKRDKIE